MIGITLYHGTISAHRESFETNGIVLSKAKPYVDFGKGFYTSDVYLFAENTAKHSANKYNIKTEQNIVLPMVVEIEISDTVLNALFVKTFENVSQEWLRFIMYNRVNSEIKEEMRKEIDFGEYDVVGGPIADARVVTLIERINKRKIDWRNVNIEDVLPYEGNSYKQFAFISKQAVKSLMIKKIECV